MDDTCAAACEISEQQRGVFADVLSQAITGELIGMANYAAMVRLYPDPDGQCDCACCVPAQNSAIPNDSGVPPAS